MGLGGRINRFFMNFEWRWSLIGMIGTAMSSFALPAWAVRAADVFAEYSPASWVAAGFLGLLLFAIIYVLLAWGRTRFIRARYDKRMLAQGIPVDPMAKTYEDRRIFLNEFCLPSLPLIEGKTFINCELIGPANILLEYGNNVQEPRYPISDAVLLKPDHQLFNAVFVRNCVFRQCSFQRLTFLVPAAEYENAKRWSGFNWITHNPEQKAEPISGDGLSLSPPDIQ